MAANAGCLENIAGFCESYNLHQVEWVGLITPGYPKIPQNAFRTHLIRGWSGGAMVLGKLPVLGVLLVWIRVGQGPTALAVGADGGCLDIFNLIYPFSPLSPSLWETTRYRLKYCIKGSVSPNTTNQPTHLISYIIHISIHSDGNKAKTVSNSFHFKCIASKPSY